MDLEKTDPSAHYMNTQEELKNPIENFYDKEFSEGKGMDKLALTYKKDIKPNKKSEFIENEEFDEINQVGETKQQKESSYMSYLFNKGINYKYKLTQNTFSKYLTDFQAINFETKDLNIILLDCHFILFPQ